jgi:hypothetical protein
MALPGRTRSGMGLRRPGYRALLNREGQGGPTPGHEPTATSPPRLTPSPFLCIVVVSLRLSPDFGGGIPWPTISP